MEQCDVLKNKVTEARGWGCIVSDSLLVSGAELLTWEVFVWHSGLTQELEPSGRKEEQVSPGCDSFSSPATATRGIHPRWALVPKGALQSLGTQTFKCSLSSIEITIICKLDFFCSEFCIYLISAPIQSESNYHACTVAGTGPEVWEKAAAVRYIKPSRSPQPVEEHATIEGKSSYDGWGLDYKGEPS